MDLEKVKALMKERGVTHEVLADEISVSRPFVTMMLAGDKIPSLAVVKRIAKYFEVSIDDIVR